LKNKKRIWLGQILFLFFKLVTTGISTRMLRRDTVNQKICISQLFRARESLSVPYYLPGGATFKVTCAAKGLTA
ncbi:hypothetical protein KA005_75275, partial [bacterium]|nr:hypothetical protein [bacterium]